MTKQTHKICIKNPLKFITIGVKKPKKYYLTAQLFYSGIHWWTRKKIKDHCKQYIEEHTGGLPFMDRIHIKIVVTGKIKDLDNKAYFWCKILQDSLVDRGLIKDDDVKHIDRIVFEYRPGDESMIITIKEI